MTWPTRPLGELASQIDYGLTASARDGEGPRFLRITDLQDGHVDWDTVPSCSLIDGLARYHLVPGDIVFARTGATTGKSFLIRECPAEAVFASYLIRVRPGPDLAPEYLARFFESPAYWRQITSSATGTAQPGVNSSKLRELHVPVGPLPEQRRIAAILDEADALRRKRREALALFDDLLRATFMEMFGDPVTNPHRWPMRPLREVLGSIDAGWSASGSERPAGDGEWGVLKVSAVSTGVFQPDENKVVVAPAFTKPPVVPRRGDLLFSRANTRELVAASCLVEQDVERLFLPDKLWRLTCHDGIASVEWLRLLLADAGFRRQLTKQATGTSGSMLNVSQDKLLNLVAPVPPFPMQEKFAAILWGVLDQRVLVGKSTARTDQVFASLLHGAFGAPQ